MDTVRIALLVNEEEKNPYFDNLFFREARKSSRISLSHIIILASPTSSRKSRGSKVALRILTDLIHLVESILLRKFNRLSPRRDSTKAWSEQRAEKVDQIKIKLPEDLPNSKNGQIASLISHGFDYVVATSTAVPIADFARVSKFGVIFVDTKGDGMDGFTDVLNQNKASGFRVLQLANGTGHSELLREGQIATSLLHAQNAFRLRCKAVFLLIRILECPQSWPPSSLKELDSLTKKTANQDISLTDIVRYVNQTFAALLKKSQQRLFSRVQRWQVLVGVPGSIWNPSLRNMTQIMNPRNRYLADPFIIERNNRKIIFVEDFDMRLKMGLISAHEYISGSVESLGEVLRENFHLSFPYVFEIGSELYMVPESSQNSDVRLYRATDDIGLEWQFITSLIRGVKATDSIIFNKDGRFWLLTNVDSSHLGEFESELHIFWSEELESNSWTSLPTNPVFVDSSRGRNAGLIVEDGRFFRVFQKQGFDSYGIGIGLAEIMVISDSEYIERETDFSFPRIPGKFGPHTLSVAGHMVAIDSWEITSKK